MTHSGDAWDHPEVQKWLASAQEMLAKMKQSAMSIMILAEPDAKLCVELGAAILYDKP
jgi:hypothetical protein